MSDAIYDNKDITKFASLVAHQLKSPVNAADSIVKTLLGEYAGSLTPQQKDLLLRIDKRLEEAIDTSERMISIVNPETTRSNTNTITDLCHVIQHCHAIYSEEAAIKDISFSLDINIEPIFVKISDSVLTEMLNSLISNALKYTPSNGKINIELSPSALDKNKVKLTISDSGMGIPKENIDKIFQPFFRSATCQESTLPGAGLGLAFVKSIVTATGGTVKAGRSKLGGAELVIELNVTKVKNKINGLDRTQHKRERVVIIGGVVAGPKVASKIIRLAPETEVTIIEKSDLLSYSGCGLPFYVSGIIQKKTELLSSAIKEVRDPVFFQNIKNVNVLNKTEALKIDRASKKVLIQNLLNKSNAWIEYDKLVLTTGSYPLIPKLEGIGLKNIFTLHGVHDAEGIKSFLSREKARDVVIIGGGLIGVEMTEALVIKGCRVTIIEKFQHIFNILDKEISTLLEKHLESHGVRVLTNTSVIKFLGNNNNVSSVVAENKTISADMVIISTGVTPKIDLAKNAGLEIGTTGAIKVNSHMVTSDSNIFAAGDCAEKHDIITGKPCYIPLGSTANKEGRVAAVNICGNNEQFPGILGATTCKVFDYCVARTGLTEKEAIEKGFDVLTSLAAGPNKEHFMPNVKTLILKLIINKKTRRILGAQAIGDSDGFNKIDIISTAITGGMTIDQISNLDLCYAPSYSLAIDSVITASNIARNKLEKRFESVSTEEVHNKILRKDQFILLDVRSHKEYEELRIPGSILIPLGILRNRLFELPKDREIVTFCSISLRGYEAALILKSAGYNNVRVMDGGMFMWSYEIIEGLQ
jgi:NADPH-dependent 2,4-dienoyl-CoA reductase/sulfur reductase-like enzyme/rhodanese-related sulfurtransferase/two-component sensor histidine kinase